MIKEQSWRLIVIHLYHFYLLSEILWNTLHSFEDIFLLEKSKIIWIVKWLISWTSLSVGCEPCQRISIIDWPDLQTMNMWRNRNTLPSYSLRFKVVVLIVSGFKVSTVLPRLRLLRGSAVMVRWTSSIIAVCLSPVQSLSFNTVYPNNVCLLFGREIKHWSWTRTYEGSWIAWAFPPFSCKPTVEKPSAGTWVAWVSWPCVDVNNINMLIDFIIKIQRRYPLFL